MEFGLLMTDIPVYISCKFKMYIFKNAQVISENVRIAFLYVLSIYLFLNLTEKSMYTRRIYSTISIDQASKHLDDSFHGVQHMMISVVIFFRIFEIFIFCSVVAICDLVHAVEAMYGLP